MDLGLFLYITKLTQKEFGSLLGITRTYVNLIKNKHTRPGRKLALRIEEKTGGSVSAKELLTMPSKYTGAKLKE